MIVRHKIIKENGEDVLIVYLDNNMEEFARELGEDPKEREKNLLEKVQDYLKEKKIVFSGKVVKVLVGALVVATLGIGVGQNINAEAANNVTTNNQVYVVEQGDNLWTIARNAGMSVNEIKDINELKTDVIRPGQTLFLKTNAEVGTYNVQEGDNLWTIAKKYGMSVDELKELNNVSDIIHPGDKLKVVQAKTPETYVVMSGDNLSTIAKNYGMRVIELKELNNLTTDLIHPGQELKVSGQVTTHTYTVKTGDNLWNLARSYNTTVDNIKEANNLKSDFIR